MRILSSVSILIEDLVASSREKGSFCKKLSLLGN